MVEEEPGEENPEITAYPRKVTGKLSHVPTLAETQTRTHADKGKMAVIRNGERFRPLGHQSPHEWFKQFVDQYEQTYDDYIMLDSGLRAYEIIQKREVISVTNKYEFCNLCRPDDWFKQKHSS